MSIPILLRGVGEILGDQVPDRVDPIGDDYNLRRGQHPAPGGLAPPQLPERRHSGHVADEGQFPRLERHLARPVARGVGGGRRVPSVTTTRTPGRTGRYRFTAAKGTAVAKSPGSPSLGRMPPARGSAERAPLAPMRRWQLPSSAPSQRARIPASSVCRPACVVCVSGNRWVADGGQVRQVVRHALERVVRVPADADQKGGMHAQGPLRIAAHRPWGRAGLRPLVLVAVIAPCRSRCHAACSARRALSSASRPARAYQCSRTCRRNAGWWGSPLDRG